MPQKKIALQIIEEALKELESPKGTLLTAIQKIQRASGIVNDEKKRLWCLIQLGDPVYTAPLEELVQFLVENTDSNTKEYQDGLKVHMEKLAKLGLDYEFHYSNEELGVKQVESGGGYRNIGFIEERYSDLVRLKHGNDGTFYKIRLLSHLNFVKKKAHEIASDLFNQLKFSGTVSNCFDLIRLEVDDKLLDLNPVIAEQLMQVFKSISSNKEEEWSQALTTCRRLLENIADELYPASTEKFNGRSVGQAQYINRIWAYMDSTITSETNRELSKAHVNFLGVWLENINKLSHKGVHSELEKFEAIKAVFHTYLVLADLLNFLKPSNNAGSKINLNTATLDEIESLLNVNRTVAKEIVKARVKEGKLDLEILSKIPGIGSKTLSKIDEVFEI